MFFPSVDSALRSFARVEKRLSRVIANHEARGAREVERSNKLMIRASARDNEIVRARKAIRKIQELTQ